VEIQMIIKYLDRVIDVTKLNSYVDNLEFQTFTERDIKFSIATLDNIKFMSFSFIKLHRDKLNSRGSYVYHLVVRNSGILICDATNNTTNSKIQHPGSIVGIDFTQLHRAIHDYRIDYIGQPHEMITVPLIFNYQLSKSELIQKFNY
jgi:hypothetical protein